MFTARPLFRIGPAVYPRHLVIGKFLAMVALGVGFGYVMGRSMADDAVRGAALTRDAYIANYDAYKADLESSGTPIMGAIAIGVVFMIGGMVFYEALSVTCSWGVAWLSPGPGAPADEGVPEDG
jgi:hypothetical protein